MIVYQQTVPLQCFRTTQTSTTLDLAAKASRQVCSPVVAETKSSSNSSKIKGEVLALLSLFLSNSAHTDLNQYKTHFFSLSSFKCCLPNPWWVVYLVKSNFQHQMFSKNNSGTNFDGFSTNVL